LVSVLSFLDGKNAPGDFDWVDAVRARGGDRAMGEIIDAFRLRRLIGGRRLLGNESASSRLDSDRAGSRQRVVGVANRVEIDPQGDRDLSHGGHSVAWLDDACPDSPKDVVTDLHVDRDAGSLDA
jgi:hypothetical protein